MKMPNLAPPGHRRKPGGTLASVPHWGHASRTDAVPSAARAQRRRRGVDGPPARSRAGRPGDSRAGAHARRDDLLRDGRRRRVPVLVLHPGRGRQRRGVQRALARPGPPRLPERCIDTSFPPEDLAVRQHAVTAAIENATAPDRLPAGRRPGPRRAGASSVTSAVRRFADRVPRRAGASPPRARSPAHVTRAPASGRPSAMMRGRPVTRSCRPCRGRPPPGRG